MDIRRGNQKETDEFSVTYNEKRMLGKFDTLGGYIEGKKERAK